MTEKQENIISAALELFANEGYNATSTSKVAKAAKVSEGLIFRHFGNKEGLLQAVIDSGETSFRNLFARVVQETEPKAAIRQAILLPASVPTSEYGFWKLQFKLKWELDLGGGDKLEPMREALTQAFAKLQYKQPAEEAQILIATLDGIGSAMLKGEMEDIHTVTQVLLAKYEVSLPEQ